VQAGGDWGRSGVEVDWGGVGWGSIVRGLLDGVVEPGRPSHRFERLGDGVEVCGEDVEPKLDRYVRLRMRRAGEFVSLVRPASFATTWSEEPGWGIFTFSQRRVFSRKHTTENWIGPDLEGQYVEVSSVNRRGWEGSKSLVEGLTAPNTVTKGHHCSGNRSR
jgi:hypothetical protein